MTAPNYGDENSEWMEQVAERAPFANGQTHVCAPEGDE